MSVSIVIPCYGERHYLDECLEALERTTDVSDGLLETILVMNGTGWNVPGYLTIQNETNEGFGRACNAGADMARSEVVCFLNMDTIPMAGWLLPLIEELNDPAIAMVGPKIIHPAGDIQTTGIRTWHGGGSAGGEELKDDAPSRDVDGVTGACMVIRKSVFDQFDGFDCSYINGYDDVDLCLQVREAGYRIRYVAESTIMHHESVSDVRWTHAHANVATMNAKWGSR